MLIPRFVKLTLTLFTHAPLTQLGECDSCRHGGRPSRERAIAAKGVNVGYEFQERFLSQVSDVLRLELHATQDFRKRATQVGFELFECRQTLRVAATERRDPRIV